MTKPVLPSGASRSNLPPLFEETSHRAEAGIEDRSPRRAPDPMRPWRGDPEPDLPAAAALTQKPDAPVAEAPPQNSRWSPGNVADRAPASEMRATVGDTPATPVEQQLPMGFVPLSSQRVEPTGSVPAPVSQTGLARSATAEGVLGALVAGLAAVSSRPTAADSGASRSVPKAKSASPATTAPEAETTVVVSAAVVEPAKVETGKNDPGKIAAAVPKTPVPPAASAPASAAKNPVLVTDAPSSGPVAAAREPALEKSPTSAA